MDLTFFLNSEVDLVKPRCPFILEPHEDCYCADLSSQNIEKALYFCVENYIQCKIYEMLSEKANRQI